MAIPKGIGNHPGVERVVPGDDQGSDRKYWVFLKDGWGFYEHGQRKEYFWISSGFGVDSVAGFREIGVEHRPDKEMNSQPPEIDGESASSFDL